MEEKYNEDNIEQSDHNNWIIIMDLDGTIIDSDIENMKILKELLNDNGLEDRIESIFTGLANGKEFNEIMIEINMLPETRKSLEKQLFEKMANRKTNLLPNVKPVLKTLNQRGFKLSIVTNNYFSFTTKTLTHHGLIDLFDEDLILCYDNYNYLKPSTKIVQEIFIRKNLEDIGKGIIIGNSLKDIEFAQNSNLFIIYVQKSDYKMPFDNEFNNKNYGEDLIKKMSYDKLFKVSNWTEVQNVIDLVLEESFKN